MCCVVSAHRTSACVQTRVHSLCTSPASTKFSMRTGHQHASRRECTHCALHRQVRNSV
eukprot:jgi/Antlo1/972/2125